ncbi:MAG: class I SAM-dependent methyltransferase [Cyclobacteriaceae bacterium]|nr:class I SAM-dependent methyltransferase [Cyclobacteriaceae bacterium]
MKKQNLSRDKIYSIYKGKLAKKYDFSLPPFFASWKKKAINESSLKKGDKVLVFCCGTGLDFPHIMDKIGEKGSITGIDFSSDMLEAARKKVEKNNWKNVQLIEGDITRFEGLQGEKADVGICTLGFSIIPEYQKAYNNLYNHVKDGGEIIVSDMQLADGWQAIFNPVTILMARKFGGSYEGHKNSMEIIGRMEKELVSVSKKEYFLKAYYYCRGKKR